jgi:hypothetical protein
MQIKDNGDGTITCWFRYDDWDSYSNMRKNLNWLVKGSNDPIASDIDAWAEEQGLYVDWDRKLKPKEDYDFDVDPAWIDFYLQTPNVVKAKQLGLL